MPHSATELNKSRAQTLWAVIALAAATVVCFGPVLTYDFISQYDDQFYLVDNPVLDKPSAKGLLSLFTSWRVTDYLPVLYASFFLDALIWGQNPVGYHLTNLLLHGANGIILFLFLSRLLNKRAMAFFVALLFVIHPVQVESVAWVPERKNLLVLLFMLTAACLIWFKDRQWLGVWFYVFALLSKSLAVVLPGLAFLAPTEIRNRIRPRPLIVMAMLAVAISLLTFLTQSRVGAVKSYHGGSFAATIVLMGQTYWDYALSLLTGRGLTPLHSIPSINLPVGISLYVVLAGAVLFLWLRKDWFMLRATALFFLFLLPVSNLVPIAVLQADRYLYIPMIMFFLIVLAFFDRMWSKAVPTRPRMGIWLAGPLLCLSYVPSTVQYLPVFRDAHAMWSHVAQDPRLQGVAYYNLGVVTEKKGDTPSAMAWYDKAREATGHCRAANNLGALLFERQLHPEAHGLFVQAVTNCPDDPGLLYNLAISYLFRGDLKEARTNLQAAIRYSQDGSELSILAVKALQELDSRDKVPQQEPFELYRNN
jgi:hypothetical protein